MTRQLNASELLEKIKLSIEKVLGRKVEFNSPNLYIKRDIGIASIDFMLIGAQLEVETQLDFDFRKLMLLQNELGNGAVNDITIQELVNFLLDQQKKLTVPNWIRVIMKIEIEMVKKVLKHAKTSKDHSQLQFSQSLLDQGVDSIDRAVIVFAMEREFQVEFSSDDIEKFKSLKDICDAIEQNKK